MIRDIFRVRLTNRVYDKFVDTGIVPERIIRMLAFKIIKGETLSQREMAVFYACTSDIEDMIKTVSKKENC